MPKLNDGVAKFECIDYPDRVELVIHKHRETQGRKVYKKIKVDGKSVDDHDHPTGNFNVCTSGPMRTLPSGLKFSWNLIRLGSAPRAMSNGSITEGK